METTQDRWNAAVKTARKNGCRVLQNVSGCCRSCISADHEKKLRVKDPDTEVLAWTYGGQGSAYCWVDGEMYNRAQLTRRYDLWHRSDNSNGREDAVYFNHSNGAAEIVAAAFKEHGFEVDWDGDDYQCVVVKLPVPVTA